MFKSVFKVFLACIRARNLPIYYEITFSVEYFIFLGLNNQQS